MRAFLSHKKEYIFPEEGLDGMSVFFGTLEGYKRKGLSCVLQRATGVKDVEGAEIYEGDKIRIRYEDGWIAEGIVVYDSGCFLIFNELRNYSEYLGINKIRRCELRIIS